MRKENIVAIGGGTGLSTILYGLKLYFDNITAIVTVSDDGGSSGMLRQDLDILPPGDIRACMLALSNAGQSLDKLFNYRFESGSLEGHNFGNLLIAAMYGIYDDFSVAVKETSNVLNISGKVLPVTLERMDLIAKLENGTSVIGESKIPKVAINEKSPIDHISLTNTDISLLKECHQAIRNSDIIVLGPGSLYTSIIPNLLIKDMTRVLKESKTKIVYICNIMTQAGETDGFSIYDHIRVIEKHSYEGIIEYVICNNAKANDCLIESYEKEGAYQVLPTKEDRELIAKKNINLIEDNFILEDDNKLRHDAISLAKKLISLLD